ncbi:MAG: TetR/AcrR family transcriptional regulator [Bacillota bacterium]
MPERLPEVLTASIKCFARYGYKKTTMEEIAHELGLTKGSLYSYARNKEDLYQQAVAQALTRWQARVLEAVEVASSPEDKFMALSFKAFTYLASDHDLRNILLNDPEIFPMFSKDDPFFAINENSRKMLRAVLEEGQNKGVFRSLDLESATWLLFSIYKMFIIDTYVVSDREATEKLFKDAVELIMHGLLR